jgi:hypothetical protein
VSVDDVVGKCRVVPEGYPTGEHAPPVLRFPGYGLPGCLLPVLQLSGFNSFLGLHLPGCASTSLLSAVGSYRLRYSLVPRPCQPSATYFMAAMLRPQRRAAWH